MVILTVGARTDSLRATTTIPRALNIKCQVPIFSCIEGWSRAHSTD